MISFYHTSYCYFNKSQDVLLLLVDTDTFIYTNMN